MNPLKLTVFAVHVETNETGARVGVVTLTGDLDTVRAVGGMLLQEVTVARVEPAPPIYAPDCTFCGGPILGEIITGPASGPSGTVMHDGETAHRACFVAAVGEP